MNTTNLTTNLPTSLPELQVPAHLATSIASAELLRSAAMRKSEREVYTTREAETRKARTVELFKATEQFMDTVATIAYYSQRYGVPATAPVSAPAPYTVADALADIRAAGLPHHMERVITKSAKTRPEVLAAIDAWRDQQAATRARNAAKWAQVQAVVA